MDAAVVSGITAKGIEILNKEFPEGVPAWMLKRGYTFREFRNLMKLRRRAFPKTAK